MDREERRLYYKKWYEKNSEKRKLANKIWRENNPEKLLISNKHNVHKTLGFSPETYNLTENYLKSIYTDICPFSGIKLVRGLEDGRFNSPSLDRMDNDRGYEQGNVMFIADIINASKSDLTYEEWLEILINLREACINKIWLDLKSGSLENAWYFGSKGRTNYKKFLVSLRRSTAYLPYTITHEDIVLTDYCPITGYKFKGPNEVSKSAFNSATIDRIDNVFR